MAVKKIPAQMHDYRTSYKTSPRALRERTSGYVNGLKTFYDYGLALPAFTFVNILFYTQPKFLDSVEMRRYGFPDVEKLFTCRMGSQEQLCEPFECRKSNTIFALTLLAICRETELSLEATWDKEQLLNSYHFTTHPLLLHKSQRHSPGKMENVVLVDDLLYEVTIQQVRYGRR
ncbi:hypothetical protein HPB48_022551 [Haemaphysalis longicornis]|uniref:Uncharacterized protein n=1 Tax=Haemaphysalis longicornis TaxID=44386 RepID=A0A9J6FPQ5_HAELO|nr:hypothetical protein HPB48_022551 [Haemaphysalis longicornis]